MFVGSTDGWLFGQLRINFISSLRRGLYRHSAMSFVKCRENGLCVGQRLPDCDYFVFQEAQERNYQVLEGDSSIKEPVIVFFSVPV